jgi:hypothetical protein
MYSAKGMYTYLEFGNENVLDELSHLLVWVGVALEYQSGFSEDQGRQCYQEEYHQKPDSLLPLHTYPSLSEKMR